MKIHAPNADYSGTDTYGDFSITFEKGVAEVDKHALPRSVRGYMEGAGYGFDAEPEAYELPAPPDPRESTEVRVGTPLRDAAVDPKSDDFLPPTNAGNPGPKGNPHGPAVVSPELHAVIDAPVVPGPVSNTPDVQEAKETAAAPAKPAPRPVKK